MDWKIFCENVKEILELNRYEKAQFIDWKIDDKKIIINYYIAENKKVQFSYTKTKFDKECEKIMENDEFSIFNDVYYEVPISIKSQHFPLIPRYDRIIGKKYNDKENNLQYEIDRPSEQFFIKLLFLKIKPNAIMILRRLYFNDKEYEFENGVEKKDIFELLRLIYKDCITLKIFSMDRKSKKDFQDLVDAFIFNINYNTDIGMRQTYDLENVHEKELIIDLEKEDFDRIDSPKRIYKKELIEQYNMAIISEDPFIKYLCYYHILEHFYEIVYKEELVKMIKDQLTLPSFSTKKEKEIVKLIDIIKEKVKIERENFDGNELEALELVIKKFVDLNNLKSEINCLDNELVAYYDKEKVPFSQGVSINFNDKDNLYKNIAKRIYITRNSLVHYKSNDLTLKERRIYRPFNDRSDLLKEVPLIRIMAEYVIINSSKILDI